MKPSPSPTARRIDLETAKGMAIILVVYGHVVARDLPDSASLYAWGKAFVYSFHIPFFMWISGFLFAVTWKPQAPLVAQWRAVLPRAGRLLPAFLAIGTFIFFGKMLAGSLVQVDNPVSNWTNLFDLVLRPTASFSSFLWYIYVLAGMFMATPLLFWICRGRIEAALLLTFLLYLTPASDWFAWVRFRELALFFVAGIYWRLNESRLNELSDRLWPIAVICLPVVYSFSSEKLLCGAISIPALLGLARSSFGGWQGWSWVATIGAFTFPIYLFNTICIGIAKAMLSMVFSWHGNGFYIFFPILLMSGILVPILIKRTIFSRLPVIDKFT